MSNFKPNKDQQQALDNISAFLNSDENIYLLSGKAGAGKALCHGEPVLTSTGFKNIEDLDMSDLIISDDGKAYPLKGIYPQGLKNSYRVSFKDSTYVDCSEDHLWQVKYTKKQSKIDILTTKEILEDNYISKRYDKRYDTYQNEYRFMIPFNKPVEVTKTSELLINPYVLGVLIGDGCLKSATPYIGITPRINFSKFIDGLPSTTYMTKVGTLGEHYSEYSLPCVAKKRNILKEHLEYYGLQGKYSYEKYIPEDYFYASIEERQELLQGLIDTDGYVVNGQLKEYSTSSPQLARDFMRLARSLGWYVSCKERIPKLNGVEHRKSYRIRQLKAGGKAITNIEYIGKKECTCISINSPSKLFITRDFNVTHNTTVIAEIAKKHKCVLTATTNKAVQVLKDVTGTHAQTIHSRLSLRPYKGTLFQKEYEPFNDGELLIIDECSMVDTELLGFITDCVEHNNIKVLFCGDPSQLNPINEDYAPVFFQEYPESILNQVMRQDEGALQDLCNGLRDYVMGDVKPSTKPNNIDILVVNDEEFSDMMKADMLMVNWLSQDSKYIAWTNKNAIKVNKELETLKKGDPLIEKGDLMTCNSFIQNEGIKISTDAVVVIQNVTHDAEESNVKGAYVEIESVTFFAPYNPTDIKKTLAGYSADNLWDKYYHVERTWIDLRHSYGVTVHKAQGSTFKRVYVDLKNINQATRVSMDLYRRLLYVATSRASKQVIYRI